MVEKHGGFGAMLEGVAWQGLDMTMSFMRLETPAFIDCNLRACDRYASSR